MHTKNTPSPSPNRPPPAFAHSAVGSNNLSGKIPAAWGALPLHSLTVDRNGGVCGGVPAGVSGALAGGGGGNASGDGSLPALNGSCVWDSDGALRAGGDGGGWVIAASPILSIHSY